MVSNGLLADYLLMNGEEKTDKFVDSRMNMNVVVVPSEKEDINLLDDMTNPED